MMKRYVCCLLYWGGMSYWRQVEDPWADPWTYGRPARVYNGEGTLVYPGRAVGCDGVAPSLRLKALRDSIEDYEYLAILERLGLAAQSHFSVRPVYALIRPIIDVSVLSAMPPCFLCPPPRLASGDAGAGESKKGGLR